MINIQ